MKALKRVRRLSWPPDWFMIIEPFGELQHETIIVHMGAEGWVAGVSSDDALATDWVEA